MMCYNTSLNSDARLSPPHKRQRLEKDAVIAIHDGEYHAREFLFKKVLAKSDVGRLSRLIIPKKFAIQNFPSIDVDAPIEDCVFHIDFYDGRKNLWTFRYCFWKCSRSYVFTGAWNKFVKAYKLQAGDDILFYKNYSGDESFFGIEVRYAGARNVVGSLANNLYNGEEFMNNDAVRVKEEHEVSASQLKELKDVMLFGVRIKRTSKDFQGGRSNDVIKEEEDYSVHRANCRRVKEEEEEFEGLKLDLNLSL